MEGQFPGGHVGAIPPHETGLAMQGTEGRIEAHLHGVVNDGRGWIRPLFRHRRKSWRQAEDGDGESR